MSNKDIKCEEPSEVSKDRPKYCEALALDILDNNWNASEHCILLLRGSGGQSEASRGSR